MQQGRELADGYTVSPIIKGGWQLSESHSDNKSPTPVRDMFEFVDAGFTTFDCADIYTGVEELIGEFRGQYSAERGEEPSIQVHTKFVPDRSKLEDISREYVERIIDRSRRRLGVDALDLVQFHWWDYSIDNYVETARILADLHDEGKIRHIGVTNFDRAHLAELVDAGVPVVSNQVQYSLLDHRPEREMVDFCAERDVRLLCYGTLAGGLLTDRYVGEPDPGPAVELENRSLTKYKLIVEEIAEWDEYQEFLDVVGSVAEKHGVSIANVATRYVLEKPQVTAAIVGSRNTEHIESNRRTLELRLDDEDHRRIEEARSRLGEVPGGIYSLERDTDSRHARIMKTDLNKEQTD
jgi:aryl-alcohol dehydrogenase-like predicted oxidoreductase